MYAEPTEPVTELDKRRRAEELAAARRKAREERAKIDREAARAKAPALAERTNEPEYDDAPEKQLASHRRHRGREALEERLVYEKWVHREKGREALEERAINAQIEKEQRARDKHLRQLEQQAAAQQSAEKAARLQRECQERIDQKKQQRLQEQQQAAGAAAPEGLEGSEQPPAGEEVASASDAIRARFDSFLAKPMPAGPGVAAGGGGGGGVSTAAEEAAERLERALLEYEALPSPIDAEARLGLRPSPLGAWAEEAGDGGEEEKVAPRPTTAEPAHGVRRGVRPGGGGDRGSGGGAQQRPHSARATVKATDASLLTHPASRCNVVGVGMSGRAHSFGRVPRASPSGTMVHHAPTAVTGGANVPRAGAAASTATAAVGTTATVRRSAAAAAPAEPPRRRPTSAPSQPRGRGGGHASSARANVPAAAAERVTAKEEKQELEQEYDDDEEEDEEETCVVCDPYVGGKPDARKLAPPPPFGASGVVFGQAARGVVAWRAPAPRQPPPPRPTALAHAANYAGGPALIVECCGEPYDGYCCKRHHPDDAVICCGRHARGLVFAGGGLEHERRAYDDRHRAQGGQTAFSFGKSRRRTAVGAVPKGHYLAPSVVK